MAKRTIARSQAIDDLRARFLTLVDDDHCLCDVVARHGIYCGGFSQWSFQELKERYGWMLKSRPRITRAELEDLANRWQLARQFVLETPVSCDTQAHETQHRVCNGWNNFSNEDLARFYREVFEEEVEVGAEEEEG